MGYGEKGITEANGLSSEWTRQTRLRRRTGHEYGEKMKREAPSCPSALCPYSIPSSMSPISARLRPFPSSPLEIHQLLQHFIAGRNGFGIRLKRALRHDHIDKLFSEIDIRLFKRTRYDTAQSIVTR